MKIGILDYNVNNIHSVFLAVFNLGYDPILITSAKEIKNVDKLIIPGIGNAFSSIRILKKKGYLDEIYEFTNFSRPILGICLGLQIFCKNLLEEGISYGIGFIDADVIKIEESNYFNIGWNKVIIENNSFFQNKTPKEKDYYFCHSYKLKFNSEHEKKYCYGYSTNKNIPSLIVKNNFLGCQFHPEKSQKEGNSLIRIFLEKY